MVRISELLQSHNRRSEPQAAAVSPEPDQAAASAFRPLPEPEDPPVRTEPYQPRENAYGLLEAIVGEAARCFDEARMERRLRLGALPELSEQLVARIAGGDRSLVSLAFAGDGEFSLERHGANVAALAVRVGCELGWRAPRLVDVALGAVLNDLGMVRCSHLAFASGALTAEEREELLDHPAWGRRLAERCPDAPRVLEDMIAQEHERADGSGYPDGLRAEDMPEDAQLLGLADCFEALTHDRPHRPRVASAEAVRTLSGARRGTFRRELLRALLDAVPLYPVGSWVQLTGGDVGRVVAHRPAAPQCPVVTLFFGPSGEPLPRSRTVDLAGAEAPAIERAVSAPAGSS